MLYQELTDFTLSANYPYVPILTGAAETGQVLQSIIGEIPATVPGCVHSDLLRAGWIEDPYYEMNALKSGWVENHYILFVKDADGHASRADMLAFAEDYYPVAE